MSRRGDILVEVTDRILHFAPDGRFIQAFGTPGEGPGELRQVSGMAALPGDSIVAVVSVARGRIVLFRIADGSVAGEVVVPEAFGAGQQWVFAGDTVYIPALFGSTAFRRWIIGQDTAFPWGNQPTAYGGGDARAYMMGGEFSAAPHGSGLVALVPADSNLVKYAADGSTMSGARVPLLRRAAIPGDLEARIREMIRRTPPEMKLLAPVVLGIHRRADGIYVLVHFEADAELFDNPVRLEYANVRYWISLLSADLARGCVDAELPSPPQTMVRPIFHGDTVSLYLRSVTEAGEVRTVLTKYLVSDDGCEWVAVEGR